MPIFTVLKGTHRDENGKEYQATADDAAYGIFELAGGVIAQINSSWCVRVRRDELVEFQVDGVEASAVAGLRECWVQHRALTPMPVWNPDLPATEPFRDQWQAVPDNAVNSTKMHQPRSIKWPVFSRTGAAGGADAGCFVWTAIVRSGYPLTPRTLEACSPL